jgi:hypothetical protein
MTTGTIIQKTDKNCFITINKNSQPKNIGLIKYPIAEDRNSPETAHKINDRIIIDFFILLPQLWGA